MITYLLCFRSYLIFRIVFKNKHLDIIFVLERQSEVSQTNIKEVIDLVEENWEEFQERCSMQKFKESKEHAVEKDCFENFRYYDVNWNGWVIRVDFEENFFAKYKTSFLMKMSKSLNEDPDLFLKFSEYSYNNYKDQILSIKRGDQIKFNATVIFEGNNRGIPILEVFEMEKSGEVIKISPHIHDQGRYSMGDHKAIHKNNSIYKEMPNLISDDEKELKQHETHH